MLSAEIIKNAPEGAQRYYQGDINCAYLRRSANGVEFYMPYGWVIYRDNDDCMRRWISATPLPPPAPKKDLTTLDTPFGELDRATQLALCDHVLDGGDLEFYIKDKVSEGWEHKPKKLHVLAFMMGIKYRAKPKQLTHIEVLEGKLKEIEAELKALKDGE